jgi:hypothetical protein
MRTVVRAAPILALLCSLIAGVGAQVLECRGGQKSQQVAELLFGRKIGDRIAVSEAKWAGFVDREITPRFPDGVTVFNITGQWRDADRNRIVREPGKLVMIVLPGKDDDLERLNQVTAAYKRRFRQQSVGVILRPACVSF